MNDAYLIQAAGMHVQAPDELQPILQLDGDLGYEGLLVGSELRLLDDLPADDRRVGPVRGGQLLCRDAGERRREVGEAEAPVQPARLGLVAVELELQGLG